MRSLEPIMLKSQSIGNLTLIPSSHLPHGEFGNWLKENWEMDQRQAYRYMDVAMIKLTCKSNLTLTDALKLAKQEAKPKESK
jgi:hypothetical protein